MNQYLLLRDNKQTGPYTAQQLKTKGLKPYDLVWHEGRSAAWRYPGELEELKSFAPIVEEQPYDRFYKKPAEQEAQTPVSVTSQASSVANKQQAQQPVTAMHTNEQESIASESVAQANEQTTGKHIHVTMPVNKSQAATQVTKTEETNKQITTTSVKTEQNNKANTTKKAASSYLISEEDDELNSSMLAGYQSKKKEVDQTSNSYLSDYEQRKAAFKTQKTDVELQPVQQVQTVAATKSTTTTARQQTGSSKRKDNVDVKALLAYAARYLQDNKNLTRSLVAAVLILGGVVIGLIINSGHGHSDTKALESLVKEIREQQLEKSNQQQPSSIAEPAARKNTRQHETDNEPENQHAIASEPGTSSSSSSGTQPDPNVRHAVIKKENNTANQNKTVAIPVSNPEPVDNTPVVPDPPKEKPNQEILEKARKNIYDLVHLEASAFKVGLLGGISDLDITVANNSLYSLDQIAVEIRYYSMDKKVVKSQTLVFNNVPPGKRKIGRAHV